MSTSLIGRSAHFFSAETDAPPRTGRKAGRLQASTGRERVLRGVRAVLGSLVRGEGLTGSAAAPLGERSVGLVACAAPGEQELILLLARRGEDDDLPRVGDLVQQLEALMRAHRVHPSRQDPGS